MFALAWLINSRGLASKVKNAARSTACPIKECGANRECPNCHFVIDNSDVLSEWPGLPIGVKFDPSDGELLVHLAAKCGVGNSQPHLLIDELIPTLEGDNGICYDHPKNLPGATKDGSSIHFFHKTMNAYATGQRKRRKVDSQRSVASEDVRWHKTGKTKAILENGVKGWKKIMVLYKSSKKGTKPEKVNWVMHQYHLGAEEDEREGDYVVSKIFYQQHKQSERNDNNVVAEDSDVNALRTSPRTPVSNPPIPPRPGKSVWFEDVPDEAMLRSSVKEPELAQEAYHVPQPDPRFEDNIGEPTWLAGESQADDLHSLDETLLCKEIFGSASNLISNTDFNSNTYEVNGNSSTPCGLRDLENIGLDSPPDFQLPDLQFSSQDSLLNWLDITDDEKASGNDIVQS
ncbi:SUPPRESSOR OF GAMMA RESPONSE 1-like isoform X2 [Pyrus x bretschneideri]|uniref:SUPPRESSOR OF GAMMA RESPONSE 1-like isoform X2 n=1 Tax=Pyrus x bretschneideri TaxID=225117 RepID=UPI00202F658E|nr:SUPPRESSOR OF GAMMA RESPONSE 1-like isoform X2 [Pyrus x bretschneideri]